jgi:hypothetical protein
MHITGKEKMLRASAVRRKLAAGAVAGDASEMFGISVYYV